MTSAKPPQMSISDGSISAVGTRQLMASLQLRWPQLARNQSPALQWVGAEDQLGSGLQALASGAVHVDMVGTVLVPEQLSLPAAGTCLARKSDRQELCTKAHQQAAGTAALLMMVCLELKAAILIATACQVPETRAGCLLVANSLPGAKPIHPWPSICPAQIASVCKVGLIISPVGGIGGRSLCLA